MTLRKNWSNIKPATGNRPLPAGGYVCRIVSATNDEQHECIEVVYDIAEGEQMGRYANSPSDMDWSHTHRIYHSDKCEGMFRRWLDCVEQSNTGFQIANWERGDEQQMMNMLIGKVYGAAWADQHNLKLWWKDGDKGKREFTGSTLPDYFEAHEIREGSFKLPKEQWRTQDRERGAWKVVEKADYERLLNPPYADASPIGASQGGYGEDIPF